MSTVRLPIRIAVLISDLHLTNLQPACRADKDWMAVQRGYLEQVKTIAGKLPVLCAGDVFDRWNPPPEVIHFALKHLPNKMICVPGQHDLPNHRIDSIHRSGYGVLVEAQKIVDVSGLHMLIDKSLIVHGSGWEQEITPPDPDNSTYLQVALIHRYCWTDNKGFPGAPENANLAAYMKRLRGYHVAVFGDNHKYFMAKAGKCQVYNCGGFIRRKSDEILRHPRVGILYSDGDIKPVRLDISKDVFHEETKDREEVPINMRDFIAGLESLGECGLDFREAVKNHLKRDDIKPKVKELVLRALDTE